MGYVYNDLDFKNIIVDTHSVQLIDFANSLEYLDNNGKHIKSSKQSLYKGNLILASPDVMLWERPSRKDDLVSLLYLMLSLFKAFEIEKVK